jgi:hypothetical protein
MLVVVVLVALLAQLVLVVLAVEVLVEWQGRQTLAVAVAVLQLVYQAVLAVQELLLFNITHKAIRWVILLKSLME